MDKYQMGKNYRELSTVVEGQKNDFVIVSTMGMVEYDEPWTCNGKVMLPEKSKKRTTKKPRDTLENDDGSNLEWEALLDNMGACVDQSSRAAGDPYRALFLQQHPLLCRSRRATETMFWMRLAAQKKLTFTKKNEMQVLSRKIAQYQMRLAEHREQNKIQGLKSSQEMNAEPTPPKKQRIRRKFCEITSWIPCGVSGCPKIYSNRASLSWHRRQKHGIFTTTPDSKQGLQPPTIHSAE